MKRYSMFACVLVVLMAASAFAAGTNNVPDIEQADGSAQTMIYGAALNSAKADTVIAFGGPGTQDGKFETAAGVATFGGFDHFDDSHKVPKWHISDFHCQNLDVTTVPNHAWWCGEVFEDDCGTGVYEGYGNGYLERLDWHQPVANSDEDTRVSVTWDMNWDSEPGYDQLELQFDDGTGLFTLLGEWDTDGTELDTTAVFTITAGNYAGLGGDEVYIRFEFHADGGWSDQDCLWATYGGACQIDNMAVEFGLEGFEVLQGNVEDCEGKDLLAWAPSLPPWTGDFSKLWTGIADNDDCASNSTTVVAFINDGSTADGEELPPSLCTTHCYGPSGYTVSWDGGLAGPDYILINYVTSPKFAWPVGYDGSLLEWDIYRDMEKTEIGFSGMYYYWSVRSTVSVDGLTGWQGWQDRNYVYYGANGWFRGNEDTSDLLLAGRTFAQLRLGVYEAGWIWNYTGDNGTPAPYLDNACMKAFSYTGPGISMREIDIAQDNFPTIDALDLTPAGLINNSIRFDMANEVAMLDHNVIDPGDSIVVNCAPVRANSVLDFVPQMYWRMKANPVFDGVRVMPALTTAVGGPYFEGVVDADTVFTKSDTNPTVVQDKWAFDLPDGDEGDGFFFPGDEIHYYIRGTDFVPGVGQGVAIAPGDTTGYSDYSAATSYNSSFVVRGLPTIFDDGTKALTQPKVLFWNDFANRGAENEWYHTLDNLGYGYTTDYDVYYTNGPSSGVSNGLGARAEVAHIAGYETILYCSGNLGAYTITNIDWEGDKGDDVGLLENWLELGNKNMAMFGDDVIFDLSSTIPGGTFMSDRLGLALTTHDLNPAIDYQAAPTVKAVSGDPIFSAGLTPVTEWIAYGGCFGFNKFDAITVEGENTVRLAYFEDLNDQDTYAFAAAALNVYNPFSTVLDPLVNNNLVVVPYGFHYIYTANKAPVPSAARTQVLEKILLFFGNSGNAPVTDVIDARMFAAKAYPNPFNPNVKVQWSLPKKAATSVKIYNVRGSLVRTLVDNETVDLDGSRVWNGKDNSGAQVASGVYFAKVSSGEYTKTLKLALVK